MRKRDRYKNRIWMAGWPDEPKVLNPLIPANHLPLTTSEAIEAISLEGYHILIRPSEGGFELDVLCPDSPQYVNHLPLSFAYQGDAITEMLRTAHREIVAVYTEGRQVRSSIKEVRRWVKSS